MQQSVNLNDVVQEQLDILETWTKDNLRAARRDALRFWALKIPAILSSVSVAALEAFGFGPAVIVLGAVTALCVAIDGMFPGGRLFNVHKRAGNELRRLQHDVVLKWRQAQLGSKKFLTAAVKAILEHVQEERGRIDKYVTDAESSLGEDRKSGDSGT